MKNKLLYIFLFVLSSYINAYCQLLKKDEVDKLNVLGDFYLDKGHYADAHKSYSKAYSLDKKNVKTITNLGHVEFLQYNYRKARSWYNKAIEIAPKDYMLYIHLGNTEKKLGEDNDAISHFSKCISIDSTIELGYEKRSFLYAKQNQHNKAIADFEKAIEINPNNTISYFNLSNSYLALGNTYKAYELLTKSILVDDKNDRAYHNRAIVGVLLGKVEESMNDIRIAKELNPALTDHYFIEGALSLMLKDKNPEQIKANKGKRIDSVVYNSSNINMFVLMGKMHQEKGEFDIALEYFNKAIEIDSNFSSLNLSLSQYYQEAEEDLDMSILYYDRYFATLKNNTEIKIAYANKADIFYFFQKYDSAIYYCNKAIEIDNYLVFANYIAANSFLELMDYSKSKYHFEIAILYSNDPEIITRFSELEFQYKHYKEALDLNKKVEKNFPDYNPAEIFNKIAVCYQQLKLFNDAIIYHEKTINLNPSADHWYNYALTLDNSGDKEKAIKLYEKAIKLNDNEFDFYANIAICYFDSKKYENALQNINNALNINNNVEPLYHKYKIETLINLKQYDNALKYSTYIINNYTNSPELNFSHAEALFHNNSLKEACIYANNALKFTEKNISEEDLQKIKLLIKNSCNPSK